MMIRHWPETVLACLFILTAGAMGIMVSSIGLAHVSDFEIRIDDDSLRTGPLVDLIEVFYGSSAITLSAVRIAEQVSAFQQVERVVARKNWNGKVRIDIVTRKPVLRVTNNIDDPVCIAPDGTPFPYWPEHGALPTYTVPARWTHQQLLSPDKGVRNSYALLLHLVETNLQVINRYTDLVASEPFDVVLSEPGGDTRLRLSRDIGRYPEEVLRQIDRWIATQPAGSAREFDARFPGMILIRPEGASNG